MRLHEIIEVVRADAEKSASEYATMWFQRPCGKHTKGKLELRVTAGPKLQPLRIDFRYYSERLAVWSEWRRFTIRLTDVMSDKWERA